MFTVNDAYRSQFAADIRSAGRPLLTILPAGSTFSLPPWLAAFLFRQPRRYYDAFPADGVGDVKPITLNTALLLTPDTVADDISTTRQRHGRRRRAIVSTIDTIGDQDFFSVELVAGRTYDIGQYLVDRRPERRAAVRRLYRALRCRRQSGRLRRRRRAQHAERPRRAADLRRRRRAALITSTPAPSIRTRPTAPPATRSATMNCSSTTSPARRPTRLIMTPTARSTRSTGAARSTAPRAIPTAQEGPRVTGNAFTGVGCNPYGIEGKNVITVYFAKAGDVFVSEDPTNPGLTDEHRRQGPGATWEKEAFLAAFDAL